MDSMMLEAGGKGRRARDEKKKTKTRACARAVAAGFVSSVAGMGARREGSQRENGRSGI